MGLIGNEIIQSRVWIDPAKTPPPNLNYKNTFPITVFDAVRKDIADENSPNLTFMLNKIFADLNSKQPIFPGKPANNLMTYAGTPGAVGAIKITHDIPWSATDRSHDKIPTEKAVGDLLMKLGLVNPDGTVDGSDGEGRKVRWSDIVGRPNIYPDIGMNDDGVITQKGVTEAINKIDSHLVEHEATVAVKFDTIQKKIDFHVAATNPHNITSEQVGAVSKALFDFHLADENPHHISKTTIGLDNVDNTADIDKPISQATQEALDAINDLISNMTDDVGGLKFVVNMEYDQANGLLTWIYNDGSKLSLSIPVDGLIDEIRYDAETKELVIMELGGTEKRISIADLFIRYIGSTGTNILVEIDGDQTTGDQVIKASIVPKSIVANDMSDNSVTTRIIEDQAVTGGKIHDLTITTVKYANNSVTTEKIAELAVTNTRLDNRAVDGRVLFSSPINDRILAVLESGTDPVWTQVISEMIATNAIKTGHILNGSVTSDKLADKSVITNRIDDGAVTNDKLSSNSITNDKIVDRTITGNKLVENPEFLGVPTITKRPEQTSDTNEIPDTRWVKDHTKNMVITNSNLGNRIVDGRTLFSSPVKDRVLVVLKANNDPVWGLINHGMMDLDAIDTENIRDLAVTSSKIHDKSIESRHMTTKAVLTDHISDDAITSKKLYKSDSANMVLASLTENGNPVYTKINQQMMDNNSVGTMQIRDRSITLAKLETSENNQRVLTVGLKNTDPIWAQVSNMMIGDRAVDGRTLFTSSSQDVILAVSSPGVDPAWLKINGEMMMDDVISRRHISDGAVWKEHLQEKLIESRHIADWTIRSNNIAPGAITGIELFKSAEPNRVLAVANSPYSNPMWLQVNSDMIEDLAVTKEKIFQSEHPYRVLAATQGGTPPEYTMITHQFIVDGTITPNKLKYNFVLHGTPELTSDPLDDADNYQLASTRWVRKTVANLINDFNPEILFDTIDSTMIQNHSITGEKLMTSHLEGPRVMGVTKAGADVEFILIEEDLIVNGAVTTNKIQRDLHLLGSPVVEVRPSPTASDNVGGGDLIPDCQWVLDRISEASIGGGGGSSGGGGLPPGVTIGPIDSSRVEGIINGTITPEGSGSITGDDSGGGNAGGEPLPNSVTTKHLMNRSVSGSKLFTSDVKNTVLAVVDANTDPQYVKVTRSMLESSRIIDGSHLFTSTKSDTVLIVRNSGANPEYGKINNKMMESDSIKTEQLVDRCVTGDKLANYCITDDKIANLPIIRENHIYDRVVTTAKIGLEAVSTENIAHDAVTSDKLSRKLELPVYTTVESGTDYERRALRNTIISPNAPTGGSNGDIWFRYI